MRREFAMLKCIAIPVLILFILRFPYIVFFLYMLNLWLPCPYAQDIATVFVMGTEAAVMILNIMTIENIRQQLIVFMRCRPARQMQYVTIVPHRQQ